MNAGVYHQGMSEKKNKPYARVIRNKSLDDIIPPDQEAVQNERLAKLEARREMVGLCDKIAESNVYFRNWKWPGCMELYPNDPGMRMIDKYYPYAKGGPLLVDEPTFKDEVEKCYTKQKVLKQRGHRYVIIETDTDLVMALEQLGGVK